LEQTYTPSEIRSSQDVLDLIRANAVHDQDAHLVREAVANISSGAGLVNTPIPADVLALITTAIEIGYASALNDVRDDQVDGLGPTGR
jgi:hypothetical protein